MKTIAIFALLLLASCATNDGFVDDEVRQCNVGDPIEINAGFLEAVTPHGGQANLTVEVQNNSDADVTVKNVRIDPQMQAQDSPLEVQGGSRTFGTEVAEGESATFEVPMSIRLRSGMMDGRQRRGFTYRIDAAVVVQLEGGEAYRCRFRFPVPF
jgi:hypothetical protein